MNDMTNQTMYAGQTMPRVFSDRYLAAIYCRLSKDDDQIGESASIQNQREMLLHYCKEQGWEVVHVFEDDGYTGLNMNRPDFQKMLEAIERKEVNLVITKDLSRLGRNYLETGELIEKYFPKKGVRYIAMNDGVDTEQENNDITPFKNILNEMYSKDVSKKVHSAYLSKARSGKFTGCLAPFGYRKDPEDNSRLVIDEETAWIVRRIFELARNGRGTNHIRRRLEDEKIPCPTWWNRQRGLRSKLTKFELADPENGRFMWDFTTIKEILSNPVYIGTIASQKANYRFKTGWINDKKPEDWICVEGVHEPLIDRDTFELVQDKVKSRKRPDAWGNYSIFAGLVKCGQCGSTMNIRRANQKGNARIFTCSKYNRYGVKHCSQHRISYEGLYQIVLDKIRDYAARALEDEAGVAAAVRESCEADSVKERELVMRSITEDKERLDVLDGMLTKLYTDILDGRITEANFNRLLERTQQEQTTLQERLDNNRARIDAQQREETDASRWIDLIKGYADITELDATTLHQLINRIIVHEDMDGDTIYTTIEIHFNFKAKADKETLVR